MTYINHGSLKAIGIILPFLGLIALGSRYSKKFRLDRTLSVNDILSILAATLNVVAGVALVVGAQLHIIGGHNTETVEQFETSLSSGQIKLEKFEYAYWIGQVVALGTIRLVLLISLRRVFQNSPYWNIFNIVNWAFIILSSVWTITCTFICVFICHLHFDDAWSNIFTLRDTCYNSFAVLAGIAISDWGLNILIFFGMLVMVPLLKLNLLRKVQAVALICTTLLAIVAALLKMILFITILNFKFNTSTIHLIGTTLNAADDQEVVSMAVFWTEIEIGVGFLVACFLQYDTALDSTFALFLPRLNLLHHALPKTDNDDCYSSHSDVERTAVTVHKSLH